MTDKIDDLEMQMEKASLLQDKFYLILSNSDEDSFNMTAYDTTLIGCGMQAWLVSVLYL